MTVSDLFEKHFDMNCCSEEHSVCQTATLGSVSLTCNAIEEDYSQSGCCDDMDCLVNITTCTACGPPSECDAEPIEFGEPNENDNTLLDSLPEDEDVRSVTLSFLNIGAGNVTLDHSSIEWNDAVSLLYGYTFECTNFKVGNLTTDFECVTNASVPTTVLRQDNFAPRVNELLNTTINVRVSSRDAIFLIKYHYLRTECANIELQLTKSQYCVEYTNAYILSPNVKHETGSSIGARQLDSSVCGPYSFNENTDIEGSDLESLPADVNECCARCSSLEACDGFVIFSNRCYLKSGRRVNASTSIETYFKLSSESKEEDINPECCESDGAKYCGNGICAFRQESCTGIGCNLFGIPHCRQCGQSVLDDCPITEDTDPKCMGMHRDGKHTQLTIMMESNSTETQIFNPGQTCDDLAGVDDCFLSLWSCEQYKTGFYARQGSSYDSQFWCDTNDGSCTFDDDDELFVSAATANVGGEQNGVFWRSCIVEGDVCRINTRNYTDFKYITNAKVLPRLCNAFGRGHFHAMCIHESDLLQYETSNNTYYSDRVICPKIMEPSFS